MKILVACEYSATVRDVFRTRGHDAWSCDLLPTDADPTHHITGDCIPVIYSQPWDIVIAHPPCTHLSASGARHWAAKKADGRQQQGIDFFIAIVAACNAINAAWAIENPVGIMSTVFRKPDQIVQPFWFGDPFRKATCLWLHRLPLLVPTNMVKASRGELMSNGKRMAEWISNLSKTDRSKVRSKTFPGMAAAMAAQWG